MRPYWISNRMKHMKTRSQLHTIWTPFGILSLLLILGSGVSLSKEFEGDLSTFQLDPTLVVNLPSTGAFDYSGVTHVPHWNAYLIVDNKTGSIYEYDDQTMFYRRRVLLGINIADVEGISWMYGERFALSDEAFDEIIVVEISTSTTFLTESDEQYRISTDILPSDNKGLEGVAFDRNTAGTTDEAFYFVKEKPPTLYHQTQSGVSNVVDLSSLMLDAAGVAMCQADESVYVLSEESQSVCRFDLAGVFKEDRSIAGLFAQPEGIDISADGLTLVIAGESRQIGAFSRPVPPAPEPQPDPEPEPEPEPEPKPSETDPEPEPEPVSNTVVTVSVAVSSAKDDAELRYRLSLGSSDLDLGQKTSLVRFTGLAIPPNAILRSASLSFTARRSGTRRTITEIRGIERNPSVDFGTRCSGALGEYPTAAAMPWTLGKWKAGDAAVSPDLSAIVQELVDGQTTTITALGFRLAAQRGKREAVSYDGSPAAAPRLLLTFEVPPSIPMPAVPEGSTEEIKTATQETTTVFQRERRQRIAVPIIAGGDDAEAKYFIHSSSVDLDLGQQHSALRFRDLGLPPGARVRSSQIEMTARRSGVVATDVTVEISGSTRPGGFRDRRNIFTGEGLAGPVQPWSIESWNANQRYRTPDIAALLAHCIHADSWQLGQDVALLLRAKNGQREASTFEQGAHQVPVLHVEFDLPPVIRSGSFGAQTFDFTPWSETDVIGFRLRAGGRELGAEQTSSGYTFPVVDIPETVELLVDYDAGTELVRVRRGAPVGGLVVTAQGPGEFTTANGINSWMITDFPRPPEVLDVTDPDAPVRILGELIELDGSFGVYFSVESGRSIRVIE